MKSILFISLLVFALGWRSGGWTQDTFESNDLQIEKARQAAENRYYERTNTNDRQVIIYPFAIYKQIVNGVNYKILFAAQKLKTNDVDFFEYVVYTGPFGKAINDSTEFKVTSEKKIEYENDTLQLNSRKATQIEEAISRYESNLLNSDNYIKFIKLYKNTASYGMSFYVVKTKSPNLLILMEKENSEFKVVAEIRIF
jgi:hypothetical protein